MDRNPRLLVIDDGERYARLVATHLPEVDLVAPAPAEPGATPELCLHDGPTALEFLEAHSAEIDLVLLDVHFDLPEERLLPGTGSLKRRRRTQGLAILDALRERHPDLPVILLSSFDDVSLLADAEEIAAQGMTYFLADDVVDLESLRMRIAAVLAERHEASESGAFAWGRDAVMRSLRGRLAVLARGSLPVLLQGETGTGKSLLAREFLHPASGRRGPFVALDVSTVPESLLPAQLFGALKGAYTGAVADRKGLFEEASGGTLFLDEVGNASPEVQKQLLVALEEGRIRPLGGTRERQVDVKLVAATNEPLDRAVAEGRFRADLYMRLNPATRVRLPALRERSDRDREHLSRNFARRAAREPYNRELLERLLQQLDLADDTELKLCFGRANRSADEVQVVIPRPAVQLLHAHAWPGNVRELSMVVQNLITFTLVQAVEAIEAGRPPSRARLQVDATLIRDLLRPAPGDGTGASAGEADAGAMTVLIEPAATLNKVSVGVERQIFRRLFEELDGDFERMAERLLADPDKARAVRLRFNQLGLKVRELSKSRRRP